VKWPFEPLTLFSADVIMIDWPWSFENWSEGGNAKNAKAQYECIPTDEAVRWPVGHLAKPDCWIWVWATHPMLADGLRCMQAWGFNYVTSGVWVKRGETGKLAMGTGYVLRSCSEPFLIGRVGDPRTFDRGVRTVIEAPRRRHSEKPDIAYETAERLFGPGIRLDLFSRRTRPGWIAWGKEAGKFDQEAAAA
jgi:N6-adenosine-specific RNA methylase IME4